MQKDPDNSYIKTILAHVDLTDASVLEIGCGDGRMTRDLAQHARKVVATELDAEVLERAKKSINTPNVSFLHTPDGLPDPATGPFDLAIYTLSLHHIPAGRMLEHLQRSAGLLSPAGRIMVIEPGDGGAFMEIKQRYGAGSGDEGPEKNAALRAMRSMPNWMMSETCSFEVIFLFTDANDFYMSKLPGYRTLPLETRQEISAFLDRYTTTRGIELGSERRLNLLTRTGSDHR